MTEPPQDDLFAPRVVLPAVVRFFTSHIDGHAVYWAIRFDYARSSCGRFIEHVNWEDAGPFPTVDAAKSAFGPETKGPTQKQIEALMTACLSRVEEA